MIELEEIIEEFLEPTAGGYGKDFVFRNVTAGTFADGRVTGETVTTITVPGTTGSPTQNEIEGGLASATDITLQVPRKPLDDSGFNPSLKWEVTVNGSTYQVVGPLLSAELAGTGVTTTFRLAKV